VPALTVLTGRSTFGAHPDAGATADHDSWTATRPQLPCPRPGVRSVREVLIIRFGALGDLALATVLLDALQSSRPPVRVTWVTKERWGSLLAGDPRIDDLVLLREHESLRSLAGRLLPHYDLVLDAHANLRSRALCFLVNASETRHLHKDTVARWLYRHGAPLPRALERDLTDRYLELLEGTPDPARPSVHVEAGIFGQEPEGDAMPRIAVAIGAAHETKRWPLDRFTSLVSVLVESGHPVTIIGGPGEEALATRAAADSGAEIWDPTRPLNELAARLHSCILLAGNDSGLLHLAEAVGTPVVALFGPTVKAWGYFPWRDESRVLEQELDCRPCSKMGERPCRLEEKLCLTRTTVEDVRKAIGELTHERA